MYGLTHDVGIASPVFFHFFFVCECKEIPKRDTVKPIYISLRSREDEGYSGRFYRRGENVK